MAWCAVGHKKSHENTNYSTEERNVGKNTTECYCHFEYPKSSWILQKMGGNLKENCLGSWQVR